MQTSRYENPTPSNPLPPRFSMNSTTCAEFSTNEVISCRCWARLSNASLHDRSHGHCAKQQSKQPAKPATTAQTQSIDLVLGSWHLTPIGHLPAYQIGYVDCIASSLSCVCLSASCQFYSLEVDRCACNNKKDKMFNHTQNLFRL